MKHFQRFLVAFVLVLLCASPAYAQITILPQAPDDPALCKKLLDEYEIFGGVPSVKFQKAILNKEKTAKALAAAQDIANKAFDPALDCDIDPNRCADIKKKNDAATNAKDASDKANSEYEALSASNDKSSPDDRGNLLGCAIKTGRISLQMIPYFITYFSNFLLSLVGIITVLFIVIGGYQYIRGGLTENKDKGKKTIEHALMGMVIAILAWVIVNLVMGALTS